MAESHRYLTLLKHYTKRELQQNIVAIFVEFAEYMNLCFHYNVLDSYNRDNVGKSYNYFHITIIMLI